ncbi:MAG: MTH938/NDUFAF3 family protein [Acidobacteriota bacterium]
MITHYEFGRLRLDEQTYSADLIIFPRRVNSTWWRKEGHRLSLADIREVFEEGTEALVIGTGFFGLMKVDEEVRKAAREKGLELHIEKTKRAVALFNELSSRKMTAGAFHLTC